MKPVLAILAHESAQPSIDDFMPQWKLAGAPLVACIPEGDTISGFDTVIHAGRSAHSGNDVFRRFLDTLHHLWKLDYDWYVVAEYDTVNLRFGMPKMTSGVVTSCLVMAHPHDTASGGMQLCSLSPWIFDRQTMLRFVSAAEDYIKKDPDGENVYGLLDRWIGLIFQKYEIPCTGSKDCFGYPWHPGSHDRIRHLGYNWIHGYKRKEDFGTLWPGTLK